MGEIMAIDPDVAVLLDEINTRLDAVETGGGGSPVDVGIQHVAKHGNDTDDGFSWQSAKLTVKAGAEATSAAGGSLEIGLGNFVEEGNIPWFRGVHINGRGVGTTVALAPGVDEHLFVSEPGLSGKEFLHWAQISNMRLRAGDSVGKDLIRFKSRVGENCTIGNIIMHPGQNGIGVHVTRGGQPIFWSDIHSFVAPNSEALGISLERQSGDIFQSAHLSNISGDNHKALIHARGFYNENVASLTINGLKSEAGFGQLDTIWLEDMQVPVTIIGASVYDVGAHPNSLVKITAPLGPSNVSVNLIGCNGAPKYWIDDMSPWDTKIPRLPGAEKIVELTYRYGEVQFRISDSSRQQLRLPRVVGLALADPPRYAPVPVDGQAAVYIDPVKGDLKILFGDGTSKTIVTDS